MKTDSFLNYLQFEKAYSPYTLQSYRSDLEQFLAYLQQTYALQEATAVEHLHIRSWIVHLMNTEKLSPKSINRKLSVLKSYFRFLMRNEVISKNPAAKAIAPKIAKKLPEVHNNEQINAIITQHYFADDFEGSRDRLIIELFFETGLRLGELLALQEKHFDTETQNVRILGKGNKERRLPFSAQLQKTLEQYINKRNALFADKIPLLLSKKGKNLYPLFVHRLLKKHLSLVSHNPHQNPHALRHTFATELLNNGGDLSAIKELLGHSSLAATQIYTHNSIEKIKRIYQKAHPKAK